MSRREFSDTTRRKAYDRAKGVCELCSTPFASTGLPEYDHRLPDALGGDNSLANCMAICKPCHAAKTGKEDVPRIRKADRQRARHVGAHETKHPMRTPPKEPKPPLVTAAGKTNLARRFQ